jgi:hypothetical protein
MSLTLVQISMDANGLLKVTHMVVLSGGGGGGGGGDANHMQPSVAGLAASLATQVSIKSD